MSAPTSQAMDTLRSAITFQLPAALPLSPPVSALRASMPMHRGIIDLNLPGEWRRPAPLITIICRPSFTIKQERQAISEVGGDGCWRSSEASFLAYGRRGVAIASVDLGATPMQLPSRVPSCLIGDGD